MNFGQESMKFGRGTRHDHSVEIRCMRNLPNKSYVGTLRRSGVSRAVAASLKLSAGKKLLISTARDLPGQAKNNPVLSLEKIT